MSADALQFFTDLERSLNEELLSHREVLQQVKDDKNADDKSYAYYRENGFLGAFVVPTLHEFLAEVLGSPEAAREALLFESFRHFPEQAGGSPKRSAPFPFRKDFAANVEEAVQKWTGNGDSKVASPVFPDMGLTSPHSTVVEAKFYRGRSLEHAQRTLAKSIYEAFFYRGLPDLNEQEHDLDWSFDYGCLLAYDATEEGLLQQAWQSFDPEVRETFWSGARTTVMILRGD